MLRLRRQNQSPGGSRGGWQPGTDPLGEPPGAEQGVQRALTCHQLGLAAAPWAGRTELPPLSRALLLQTAIFRQIFCVMWNQTVPAVNQKFVSVLLGKSRCCITPEQTQKLSSTQKCLQSLSGKEISTSSHKGKKKLLCGHQDRAEEPRRLKICPYLHPGELLKLIRTLISIPGLAFLQGISQHLPCHFRDTFVPPNPPKPCALRPFPFQSRVILH